MMSQEVGLERDGDGSSLLEMAQQRTDDDGFEMDIEHLEQSLAKVVVQEPS
jgi:hypothetical protein